MARIFISYRRTDAAGYAGLLLQHLEEHFPGEIFLDRSTLEDGARWDLEIAKHLNECEALIVLIGPDWLKAQDPDSGQRRLDNPGDWVRREVEAGLQRGVRVIPVLMGGARMPKAEHLPEPIRGLASREYREVSDRDARDDVGRLTGNLKKTIGALAANTAAYLRSLRRDTEYIDIRGLNVSRQQAYRFRIDELSPTAAGSLPLGNQTSQFFANVYLNPLDHYVNQELRPGAYIRYVDDFVLFDSCAAKLGEMRNAIDRFLEGLRLAAHERKSRVYRCVDGVTFLGWRVFPRRTRLVHGNVVRFRRRLRSMEEAFREGEIGLEEVKARIHSWIGHAASGDTWRLREQLFGQFTLVKGSAV
jgi:TIR domain-containing protein